MGTDMCIAVTEGKDTHVCESRAGPSDSSNARSPELSRIIQGAESEYLSVRIASTFLRSNTYDRRERTMGLLRAGMYWEGLEPFLRTSGWTLHGAISFDHSGSYSAPLVG